MLNIKAALSHFHVFLIVTKQIYVNPNKDMGELSHQINLEEKQSLALDNILMVITLEFV